MNPLDIEFVKNITIEELDALSKQIFALEDKLTHSYDRPKHSPYRQSLFLMRHALGDIRQCHKTLSKALEEIDPK